MKSLCGKINCKYITWDNGGRDSVTFCLVCKLKKEITDERHCAKCKDKVLKRSEEK